MWLLQGTFTFALLLAVDALESCSPKSCKIGLVTRKAACGSDGFSYYNRCHLEMARCHNKNLTFAHRGACRAQKTCRDYLKAYPGYTFKPQCRSDGNYSAGQCNADFGYCWCVTAQGTPIPFSATRMKPGGKHRCGKAKKTTRSSSTKQRKNQRACNRDDKAIFNSNLLKIFTTEWGRETSSKSTATDKVVLDWKFNLMDLNHDDMLDKTEYRDLRRLMKKVVKPKRCAKSFAKACDMNRDQVIGRQEWAQCLTRDGMDDVKGAEDGPNPDEDEDDDDEEEYFKGSFPPSSILTDMPRPLNGGPNYDDESTEKKDDDATDCLSDRKVALDEDSQLYVPECTADGRYAKVQCYKSAGYCWCVNEDTGKNIPGTAVKDQVPKCDQIASSSRPMKGCPEDKKIAFLKDLMEYLHASMIKETNGTSIIGAASSSSWRSSKEEQIASWSFVFFDKNKNKQLDKVEWKGFKDKMVTVKSLKRCGKKLPRYCDINKDRHISMTEWLDCLNTHRYQEQIDSSTLPSSTKSGKNPLSLLMED